MENPKDIKYWSIPFDSLLNMYGSAETGLTSAEAASRLKKYGENSIKEQNKIPYISIFANQFKNPIIVILIFATIISAMSGEVIDAIIIFLIIFCSSVLSFMQEYRADNAIKKLRAKVQVKSIVIRDGKNVLVPSKDIVIGDVINLSAGSLVPADCVILESFNFFVNQSILTGESLPNEKKSMVLSEETSVEERTNCVFMGSSFSGTCSWNHTGIITCHN